MIGILYRFHFTSSNKNDLTVHISSTITKILVISREKLSKKFWVKNSLKGLVPKITKVPLLIDASFHHLLQAIFLRLSSKRS